MKSFISAVCLVSFFTALHSSSDTSNSLRARLMAIPSIQAEVSEKSSTSETFEGFLLIKDQKIQMYCRNPQGKFYTKALSVIWNDTLVGSK